jgi:hypothetical protein
MDTAMTEQEAATAAAKLYVALTAKLRAAAGDDPALSEIAGLAEQSLAEFGGPDETRVARMGLPRLWRANCGVLALLAEWRGRHFDDPTARKTELPAEWRDLVDRIRADLRAGTWTQGRRNDVSFGEAIGDVADWAVGVMRSIWNGMSEAVRNLLRGITAPVRDILGDLGPVIVVGLLIYLLASNKRK